MKKVVEILGILLESYFSQLDYEELENFKSKIKM